MTINVLLGKIATLLINPLIILGFVIAIIYLFYSIIQMIWSADSSSELSKTRDNVKWGVVGLFIMFSVYGILNIVIKTFNITCTGVFFC